MSVSLSSSVPSIRLLNRLTFVFPCSPSGNAYGITYLSSRPFAPEGRRESPRRASHKEHPQGLQSQG
jgi:hypothetical protein